MRKNLGINFMLLLILMLHFACNDGAKSKSDAPFSDCKMGAPKAIFSKNMNKVVDHQFELTKDAAIEKITLEGGTVLELIQSGCDKPKQEFLFSIPTSTQSFVDADWIAMSIDMFGLMGSLSESLTPFLLWRGAIQRKEKDIKLGMPLELDPGFFMKIDKVAGSEEGKLIVTLYQE
jgi:hypothetical protein